jgi:cytochrome c oxidase subunit 1
MFGGTAFAFFAGIHYWYPKIVGRMYHERFARAAWLILFIGFNTLYFPMFVLGWMGMPRRYYDYLPQFHLPNLISTIGSWILATGVILMFFNLAWSARRGGAAGNNPWGGTTLEWQTTSPPPEENFEAVPLVTAGPYEYPESESVRARS